METNCFKHDIASACRALSAAAGRLLVEKRAHAAVAESLTGGLVASRIVDVSGASQWFSEGCVTYTDSAKENRLGIDPKLIEEHTAVSRETARAMAEGMLLSSGADAAVSTTGLAGPGPDESGRPAGLVFIGGATKKGSVTRELMLSGSRDEIRSFAAFEALKLLYKLAELI